MLICVILVTQNKQTNITTINKKYRFQACPQSNDITKYANVTKMVATGQSMEFLRISPIFPMAKKKNPHP